LSSCFSAAIGFFEGITAPGTSQTTCKSFLE
jgi:hypothetical protein